MQNLKKRLAIWAVVTLVILLVPLVAMQFSEEVKWGPFDFVFMGTLIFGIGLTYELVSRNAGTVAYRAAVGVGLVASFLLVWINAAVGIIGDENPANLLYAGVLAVAFIGGIITRLKPHGMARTMFTTAVAQMLVPVIALMFWKFDFEPGVVGVFGLNAVFALLWIGSALLFLRGNIMGLEKNRQVQEST